MQIHVTCPNGHKLKVGRKFAGKTGRCPSCQAVVKIPELTTRDTEEDLIMEVLAARGSIARAPEARATETMSESSLAPDQVPVHQDARHAASEETKELSADDSAVRAGGSSVMRRAARRCAGCNHRVSANYSVCPHCKRYMTETPEASEHESTTCPSCGVPSFPGADVCMNCGLQLLLRE